MTPEERARKILTIHPTQVDAVVEAIHAAVAEEMAACALIANRAIGRMDCDPKTAEWIMKQIEARGANG